MEKQFLCFLRHYNRAAAGLVHRNGLPDFIGSSASLGEDFKLWLSRHPEMSIEEAIHRCREEQKAKQLRKCMSLH